MSLPMEDKQGTLIFFFASFLLGYLFLPSAFPEAERRTGFVPSLS